MLLQGNARYNNLTETKIFCFTALLLYNKINITILLKSDIITHTGTMYSKEKG